MKKDCYLFSNLFIFMDSWNYKHDSSQHSLFDEYDTFTGEKKIVVLRKPAITERKPFGGL